VISNRNGDPACHVIDIIRYLASNIDIHTEIQLDFRILFEYYTFVRVLWSITDMDDLDAQILGALQRDGRAKNADLAREFGVAPSTMLERVRRLEERGIIRGYRAVADLKALGLTVQGFVMVILDRHNTELIRRLEEEIQSIPHVRSCFHLTGRFDYMLQVAARDLDHLGDLIKSQIATIPGIGRLETFVILSEVKRDESPSILDRPF
jgi:Lrp/AsnC family leucine-responsive transcriptional regulator